MSSGVAWNGIDELYDTYHAFICIIPTRSHERIEHPHWLDIFDKDGDCFVGLPDDRHPAPSVLMMMISNSNMANCWLNLESDGF